MSKSSEQLSPQKTLVDPPSDAISSIKFSPYSTSYLLVSSWDRHVYLYDVSDGEQGRLITKFEHRAPVLDVCFGKDDNEAFSGGLDMDVRKIDLSTGEQTVLSTHNKPVKALVYSPQHSMLISGSWDSSLHIHHPSNHPDDQPSTIPLPSKVFSLALTPTKVVVAMASRTLYIYDLTALALLARDAVAPPPNELRAEPWQRRESSLKFLFRATACMPGDEGYATSSIEGRIAVEMFDASEAAQARKYAFKCHRQPGHDPATGEEVDVVYPVNALAFHPVEGTMASGGGEGYVMLWDTVGKRRVRAYQKLPASVAALAFNREGNMLAIAVSPGFEDAKEQEESGVVKLFVRELSETEAKPKKK
ncbi:MAG: hypothetical protein M1821_000854 [Bathelium mastoideum]|nr:MAG: hypothetical protein M1821_000854 [Bathelium mastoideum]